MDHHNQDNRVRIRLTLLFFAGVLLVGGVVGWVWYHSSKKEELTEEFGQITQSVASLPARFLPGWKKSRSPQKSTFAENATANSKKALPLSQNALSNSEHQKKNALNITSKPADNSTEAPIANQNALSNVESQKGSLPRASNSADSNPEALAAKVSKSSLTKPVLDRSQEKKGANLAASGNADNLKTPNTQAAEVAKDSLGQEGNKKTPATTRIEATSEARKTAGREDPMMPICSRLLPFPRTKESTALLHEANTQKKLVPPPPPKVIAKLVPPPPPSDIAHPDAMAAGSLPLALLPVPPSKPSIANDMKLVAIIGDKIIISFDQMVRKQNKWPKTITLGPGEQFESISVVGINQDSATLEEDGERMVKALEPVR